MMQNAVNLCHQLEVLKKIPSVSPILWVDKFNSIKITLVTCTKHKTTISVHEFLSDSTFDYSIMLLFDVRFYNNFIFLFYRYYYFNVYFINVC